MTRETSVSGVRWLVVIRPRPGQSAGRDLRRRTPPRHRFRGMLLASPEKAIFLDRAGCGFTPFSLLLLQRAAISLKEVRCEEAESRKSRQTVGTPCSGRRSRDDSGWRGEEKPRRSDDREPEGSERDRPPLAGAQIPLQGRKGETAAAGDRPHGQGNFCPA
jgi:hypothetical protein